MNGLEIEVLPRGEIADVPPEVGMGTMGRTDVDPLYQVDRRVGAGEVFLEASSRLIIRDIDKIRGDACIVIGCVGGGHLSRNKCSGSRYH